MSSKTDSKGWQQRNIKEILWVFQFFQRHRIGLGAQRNQQSTQTSTRTSAGDKERIRHLLDDDLSPSWDKLEVRCRSTSPSHGPKATACTTAQNLNLTCQWISSQSSSRMTSCASKRKVGVKENNNNLRAIWSTALLHEWEYVRTPQHDVRALTEL